MTKENVNEPTIPPTPAVRQVPKSAKAERGSAGAKALITTAAVAAALGGWASLSKPEPIQTATITMQPVPTAPTVQVVAQAIQPPAWLLAKPIIPTPPALAQVTSAVQAHTRPVVAVGAAQPAAATRRQPVVAPSVPAQPAAAAPVDAPPPAAPVLRDVAAPPAPAPVATTQSSR